MARCQTEHPRVDRRCALKLTVGTAVGASFLGQIPSARAQTTADVAALNFMLNIEYLLAQFTSVVVGETVNPARITGGGIAGVPPIPGRKVTFTDTLLQTIVREMAADNRAHLVPMRVVTGASAIHQPLIDLSATATAPFTVAMRRAGVVGAEATFDPYASEENLLYALFYLKSVSVAAYRGLAAGITNQVVLQNFAGLLGTESIHAATIRSYLHTRGATAARLRTNADAIAAFQRSLNGGTVFQGISPSDLAVAGGTVRVANGAPVQWTGDVGGRSAAQILNQLYLTDAAVTSGGFFPNGVNGAIRASAAA